MTYKRFEYIAFDGFTDHEAYITPHKVANLLNEFYEKNQELVTENEQLKKRNDFLKKQLDRVCSENEMMGDKLKKIGRIL